MLCSIQSVWAQNEWEKVTSSNFESLKAGDVIKIYPYEHGNEASLALSSNTSDCTLTSAKLAGDDGGNEWTLVDAGDGNFYLRNNVGLYWAYQQSDDPWTSMSTVTTQSEAVKVMLVWNNKYPGIALKNAEDECYLNNLYGYNYRYNWYDGDGDNQLTYDTNSTFDVYLNKTITYEYKITTSEELSELTNGAWLKIYPYGEDGVEDMALSSNETDAVLTSTGIAGDAGSIWQLVDAGGENFYLKNGLGQYWARQDYEPVIANAVTTDKDNAAPVKLVWNDFDCVSFLYAGGDYEEKIAMNNLWNGYEEYNWWSGSSTINDNWGFSFYVYVYVVNKPVEQITLSETNVDVLRTFTYQLSATVSPFYASDKTITWSSNNESVATVDQNGLVTAKAEGTAIITTTAKDGSGVSASCVVNVLQDVERITLSESNVDVLRTLTYQLTATVSPTSAHNKSVTWSSSNESVATVDQNGLVTAKSLGTATITATANDGSGVTGSCKVNVKDVTISLSTKTISLKEKQTYSEQEVTILPESYGLDYVTWSTSDPSVATINSAGTITAVSPGIATITYALDYGSDIKAECRVIVYDETVVYVGGLYYILDAAHGTATVTSIYGAEGNGLNEEKIAQYYSGTISIPSTVTYDGVTYDVKNVGQYAFVCQNDLQSLYIPASVVNIEKYAATGAKKLDRVNVEENSQLEQISYAAFKDCVGMRYFTFDGTTNHMKSINNYAFYGCSNLQRVKWSDNTTIHTIADYAFYKCTSLNNFTMPNTVTSVGNYSFRYDAAMKKITLSSALNIINEYAFGECGFSLITLPESLGSIQAGAFINNSYLTDITIPAKVQGIGSAAFENNSALQTVSFKTSISTMTIGDNAFNECPLLTRVNIDHLDSWAQTNFSNVKANPASTAHHLYMNDEEIIDAELPVGTKYVNNNAFNGCSSIKSIILPATTDHINDDIFVGCTSLTDVYCLAEEVPAFIGTGDPDDMRDVFNRATLHVPYGTESDYKSDDWWKRFSKIKGFDATGINGVNLEADNTDAVYYRLDGLRISGKPQQAGVYIRVKDGKSQKVLVGKP